jgi:hypothetical protein
MQHFHQQIFVHFLWQRESDVFSLVFFTLLLISHSSLRGESEPVEVYNFPTRRLFCFTQFSNGLEVETREHIGGFLLRWRARVFLGGGRASVDLVAHLHEVRVVHHHFDHVLQNGVADEDRVHFAVQILRLP